MISIRWDSKCFWQPLYWIFFGMECKKISSSSLKLRAGLNW